MNLAADHGSSSIVPALEEAQQVLLEFLRSRLACFEEEIYYILPYKTYTHGLKQVRACFSKTFPKQQPSSATDGSFFSEYKVRCTGIQKATWNHYRVW